MTVAGSLPGKFNEGQSWVTVEIGRCIHIGATEIPRVMRA